MDGEVIGSSSRSLRKKSAGATFGPSYKEILVKLKIVAVDKMKNAAFRELTDDYFARLQHYLPTEVVEVRSAAKKASDAGEVKRIEAEALIETVTDEQVIVAMDERGKPMSSEELADWLNDQMVNGVRSVAFVIGGSWGLDRSVRKKAHRVISLSEMTMPHEMARMFLTEQLYRAMTILRGEPYHK